MRKPVIRTLAFDPGWDGTGWSVLETTVGSDRIDICRFGELVLTANAKKVTNRAEAEEFGIRVVTMNLLEKAIDELFTEFRPHFLATESGFVHRFPAAYAALVQWLTILQMQAYRHRYPVYTVTPKQAKLAVTGDGSADKQHVQNAILTCENVHFRQRNCEQILGEHAADSAAVGITFIRQILPDLITKFLLTHPEFGNEEELPTPLEKIPNVN